MSTETAMLLAALALVLWIECGRLTLASMIAQAEATDRQLFAGPIADRRARVARNIIVIGAVAGWPLVQLTGIMRARRGLQ